MSILDQPLLAPSAETARALKRLFGLTLMLALVAAAVLMPVLQNSDEAAQGYQIAALEQRKVDLDAQIYAEQAQIAQLGSLARIDGEARGRLGLVPQNSEIAVSVSVPKPAYRPIPNQYLPAEPVTAHTSPQTLWQRLLRLLPLP